MRLGLQSLGVCLHNLDAASDVIFPFAFFPSRRLDLFEAPTRAAGVQCQSELPAARPSAQPYQIVARHSRSQFSIFRTWSDG